MPTVVLSTPSAVCSGSTSVITSTVTSDPSTGGTYTWSTNVSGTTQTSATYGEAVTGEVTYDYTSSKGCKAIQAKTTATINPIPVAPTTKNVSYCLNTDANNLSNQVTVKDASGTLQWYGTDATGGTASTVAPTPSTSSAVVTTYYVSQKVDGCESDRSPIVVTVNDKLSPSISLSTTE